MSMVPAGEAMSCITVSEVFILVMHEGVDTLVSEGSFTRRLFGEAQLVRAPPEVGWELLVVLAVLWLIASEAGG